VVKPLKGIARVGKLKIAVGLRDRHILHLGHNLIFILNSDIAPDGSAVIFQSHPESNILSWDHRIGIRVQVFNVKGTNSLVAQGPSTGSPSRTERLCRINWPPITLAIYILYREAVIRAVETVVPLWKINSILTWLKQDIPRLCDDFILIPNGKSDPPRMPRLV
jgi:hypothetical protein